MTAGPHDDPDRSDAGLQPGALSLFEGLRLSEMDSGQVWLRQVGIGGTAGELEVEAYVLGLLRPDAYQHDLIAQAINEHFIEMGGDHPVCYSDDLGLDY